MGGRNSHCGGQTERVVIRVVGFSISWVEAMWDVCLLCSNPVRFLFQ